MIASNPPTIPYALALFGYATAILVVGLNKTVGWPKCTCERDENLVRKSIACVVLAFGSVDQLIVSLLLFVHYPGNTLQATTFGAFGVLWLLVFLFDYFLLDSRILAPVFLIFAVYTAAAGYFFFISGSIMTGFLMWSATLLNLMFTTLDATGKRARLTGAVGLENAIIAYYLVFAMIVASQLGTPLPG